MRRGGGGGGGGVFAKSLVNLCDDAITADDSCVTSPGPLRTCLGIYIKFLP